MSKKVRAVVNLSEDDLKFLQQVADDYALTMSDVIRESIALQRVADRVRKNKGKLIAEEMGNKYEIIL